MRASEAPLNLHNRATTRPWFFHIGRAPYRLCAATEEKGEPMKRVGLRMHARRAMVLGVLVLCVGQGVGFAQAGAAVRAFVQRSFGIGVTNYPGGTTRVVYEILQAGQTKPHLYTLEVAQNGDRYDVTESTTLFDVALGAVAIGFGPSGAAAAMAARFERFRGGNIDLSPLQVLEERGIVVEPNQSYYLPDGARLVTGDPSVIAGIDVVIGVYIHPGFPGQRVEMAFTKPEISGLLPFPPLSITEASGEIRSRIVLIEFSHTK